MVKRRPHYPQKTRTIMILKTIGSILLAGALFVAVGMQMSGHGLVTTRPSPIPPSATPGPQGTTMVVVTGPSTVFHLKRIVPLVGLVALGLVCFFFPNRDEHNA
jgi:hypothetical protein